MHFVFNRIPRLAKIFYFIGFLMLLGAMLLYFIWPAMLNPITLQQIFILGAIVVAVGSVINTLHQFKRRKPENKE